MFVSYLFINLNATITNAVDANGNLLGIVTTVNTGSGPVAGGLQPIANQPGTLTVNGLKYVVPSPNTQTVTLNISGIRVAVPTLPEFGRHLRALRNRFDRRRGVFLPNGQSLLLGAPVTTVLSSVIDNGIPCLGSPLPTTTPLTFQSFISAVSSSSTIRLTEGDAASFVSKNKTDPTVTNGIRFVVNLSGYGSNASVYVPDAIVGSTGNAPTSGGAFGTTINAGTYSPGQNQLLLARVNGADANRNRRHAGVHASGSTTTFLVGYRDRFDQRRGVRGLRSARFQPLDGGVGAGPRVSGRSGAKLFDVRRGNSWSHAGADFDGCHAKPDSADPAIRRHHPGFRLQRDRRLLRALFPATEDIPDFHYLKWFLAGRYAAGFYFGVEWRYQSTDLHGVDDVSHGGGPIGGQLAGD